MADIASSSGAAGRAVAAPPVVADRYVIERELGRGGAAVVFLARDRRYDRDVAVKILREEIAGAASGERFLQEILITARLQHPHIVQILDSGDVNGLPYYVAPFLDGGSLRALLDREHELPLGRTLAIAAEIADALEYAHARGILHRDIKPDNILFSGGHSCVADFGIAQALTVAAGDRLTSSGILLGTPAYMSPEQASGERTLDGRSDVFSLACVVYEMLAGSRPFTGSNQQSVIAQRFAYPPRPIGAFRAGIPEATERAVMRALSVSPADRPQTARAFARELRGEETGVIVTRTDSGAPRGRLTSSRRIAGAVGAVGVVGIGLGIGAAAIRGGVGAGPAPIARRFAIAVQADDSLMRPEAALARIGLRTALQRWRGVTVVEVPAPQTVNGDVGRAARAARDARAARLVVATLAPLHDGAALRVVLHDDAGHPMRESMLGMNAAALASPADYNMLIAALLRDSSAVDEDHDHTELGTTDLDAWYALVRGRAALERWDLAGAETHLRTALARDGRYPHALLALAQLQQWRAPRDVRAWGALATRALADVRSLSPADSALAAALAALGANDFPGACAAYDRLRSLRPTSAVPWFGMAACIGGDPVVVPARESPTRWAFRGSYERAIGALEHGLSMIDAAPPFVFAELERMLIIEPGHLRLGVASGSTARLFAAYPARVGDTVVFIPSPASDFATGTGIDRTTLTAALRQNASRLERDLAIRVARDPESPDALESLARVQEVRGEQVSASDSMLLAFSTIERARARAHEALQRTRLGVARMRLLLKELDIEAARALGDSLLSAGANVDSAAAAPLAGVAAALGRIDATARLQMRVGARAPNVSALDEVMSPRLAGAVAELRALSALGACDARVLTMDSSLTAMLALDVAPESRDSLRRSILRDVVPSAVPCLGAAAALRLGSTTNRLVRLEQFVARGDTAAARATFRELRRLRAADRPGDIALDHTYLEAWVHAQLGDTAAAVAQLDQTLENMSTLGTSLLDTPAQAGALGRAMALRATLAAAKRDSVTAQRWAARVVALWSPPDPALSPVIALMARLAAERR